MALTDLAASLLLAADSPVAHPVLAEELAHTAAVTALRIYPYTAMTASYLPEPGCPAPASVRRAAGYIDAYADQPVSLDDIATVAGVSGRALRHAFHRSYGTTPAGYLRRIRLERAHAQLLAASAADGTTVTEVARRWGWTSHGQFAAAYRQRFGVPPGRTLRA
jgi:AraC-like DNA-binding protein